MKKESITICVENNITNEELRTIRNNFKSNGYSDKYRLNIIVSGNDNAIDNIGGFILSNLK